MTLCRRSYDLGVVGVLHHRYLTERKEYLDMATQCGRLWYVCGRETRLPGQLDGLLNDHVPYLWLPLQILVSRLGQEATWNLLLTHENSQIKSISRTHKRRFSCAKLRGPKS